MVANWVTIVALLLLASAVVGAVICAYLSKILLSALAAVFVFLERWFLVGQGYLRCGAAVARSNRGVQLLAPCMERAQQSVSS
jgi:hypothetical protein